MARPIDTEKRQAIIDAAAAAFLERGYEGTSIDVVADIAGAARRTVYHQFGSKDGLFAAVIEHLWSGLKLDDAATTALPVDGLAEITQLATTIATYWRSPTARAFLRMAIVEGPRFPALHEGYFRKGKLPAFTAMAARLSTLSKARLLSRDVADNPELAAHQLIGLLNEPLLWPQLLGAPLPSEADYERAVKAAVDVFMARYGAEA